MAPVPGIPESSDDDSVKELPPGIANRADRGLVVLPGHIKEKLNMVNAAEIAELEALGQIGKDAVA